MLNKESSDRKRHHVNDYVLFFGKYKKSTAGTWYNTEHVMDIIITVMIII